MRSCTTLDEGVPRLAFWQLLADYPIRATFGRRTEKRDDDLVRSQSPMALASVPARTTAAGTPTRKVNP